MDVRSSSALLYIVLSILHANRKPGRETVTPEILYLGGEKLIRDLISMFGGSTVYVPTEEEFYRELRVGLYAYFAIAEKKSDDWFEVVYGADGNEMRSIRTRVKKWLDNCTPEEIEFLRLIPGSIDIRKQPSDAGPG